MDFREDSKYEKVVHAALVLWAALAVVAGRLSTALTPGSRDAQLFAYMGLQWSRGYLPYVDVWDNKPPGIFGIVAAAFKLFGPSFRVLAIFEGFSLVGLLITIYLLLRRWKLERLVALSAVVACAIGADLAFYNQGGNLTEVYLLFPAALSVYSFACSEWGKRPFFCFAAGACAGFAALLKPVGLAPLFAQIVLLFVLAAWFRKSTWRTSAISAAVGIAGAIAAWIPALIYFARHGATWSLLDASVFYNFGYGAHSGAKTLAPLLLVVFLRPLSIVCAFAFVGALLRGRQLRRKTVDDSGLSWLLALLWLMFDAAGVLVGGRAYEHYFLTVVPSLTVVAAFGLQWLITAGEGANRGALKYALVSLMLLPLFMTQVQDNLHWLRTRGEDADKPAAAIAQQIRKGSASDATLFVWPYRPMIFFETKLRSTSQYPMAHHLYDNPRAYSVIGQRIVAQLQQHPPTFAVDCAPKCVSTANGEPDPVYEQFRSFLQVHYEPRYVGDGLMLYERRSER